MGGLCRENLTSNYGDLGSNPICSTRGKKRSWEYCWKKKKKEMRRGFYSGNCIGPCPEGRYPTNSRRSKLKIKEGGKIGTSN